MVEEGRIDSKQHTIQQVSGNEDHKLTRQRCYQNRVGSDLVLTCNYE